MEDDRPSKFRPIGVLIIAGYATGLVWPTMMKLVGLERQLGAWGYLVLLAAPVGIFLGIRPVPNQYRGPWRSLAPVIFSALVGVCCVLLGMLVVMMFTRVLW